MNFLSISDIDSIHLILDLLIDKRSVTYEEIDEIFHDRNKTGELVNLLLKDGAAKTAVGFPDELYRISPDAERLRDTKWYYSFFLDLERIKKREQEENELITLQIQEHHRIKKDSKQAKIISIISILIAAGSLVTSFFLR